MKSQTPNKPGVMHDTEEAIEKYLFYVHARATARYVLGIVCGEFLAGSFDMLDPIELELIQIDIEKLFDELDECDRLLYNRELRH